MALATIESAARVAPDTEYRSHIVDPMPEYAEYAGMLGAHLRSGALDLAFAYGWESPATIHAAIAQLRDALDRLDVDVDLAMDRQAGITAPANPGCGHCGEPAGAPSGLCAACESLVDEPQAAPALPDGVEFVGTVGQFLDSIEAPDATYAGSRCCGAAEGTPHWVYCPNWARGVPENELRALAGDR